MKKLISPVIWLAFVPFPGTQKLDHQAAATAKPVQNLFIITLDGFRWQELFSGADSSLISNTAFTPDAETINLLYWDDSPEERRKKLMPFFWNVIAGKGQIYGNRKYNNRVDAANPYALSYPGYNEMLTGSAGFFISSNRKINNPNISVLEYLNSREGFKGKVAAFSSWDVFPYILNTERSKLVVNSGYSNLERVSSERQEMINTVQSEVVREKTGTRYDELTFLAAREYIKQEHPRVLFIGFGETDEFAHDGRYDLYLQQAAQADRMIGELWHWVQTTPGYKNNTAFMITTDHGRGSKKSRWTSHGDLIRGSSQAWFALIGPGVQPAGEIRLPQQHYLGQMAGTIAELLGEDFTGAGDFAEALVTISAR